MKSIIRPWYGQVFYYIAERWAIYAAAVLGAYCVGSASAEGFHSYMLQTSGMLLVITAVFLAGEK